MPRIDLPEVEDQAWCPAWLRDAMTGYLQSVTEAVRPYDVAVPALVELLRGAPSPDMVDMASGAGGPWPQLLPALRDEAPHVRLTLTDLRPNLDAARRLEAEHPLTYRRDSVSALAPPPDGHGVRTIFTGLHHFGPDEVRRILRQAQDDRVGFAAFEATRRSPAGLLVTCLIPLLVLLLMPRVRPRRFVALLFTYLPPVLPLAIWWDGLASTLRTYTVGELEAIVGEFADPAYSWRIEEVPVAGGPIPVLQIVGHPTLPSDPTRTPP